jgi:hypothetical protein
MGKLMVGVVRVLPLCAVLLLVYPTLAAAQPAAPADLTVGAISTTAINSS